MRLSVILPVLNEQETIGPALDSLSALQLHEVLVVDGGSTDLTRELAGTHPVTLLSAGRGRARQMNHGAAVASGDVLLFLHADTRLPPSALEDVRAAFCDPDYIGGRFDVELEGDHWALKWIGPLISLRSRVTKVATGDQAIFVRRAIFKELEGFPEIPLMEDIAFCRLLKKKGRVACLKSHVVTSARRWEREGVWLTVFKMWMLKLLFLAGLLPVRLKRFYADTR